MLQEFEYTLLAVLLMCECPSSLADLQLMLCAAIEVCLHAAPEQLWS